MKIFISYNRYNMQRVEKIADQLEQLGHSVWYDKELKKRGGHDWWPVILDEIKQADLFIFALSPKSADSEPCRRELKWATQLNKRILCVKIERFNDDVLPADLPTKQYVDYTKDDSSAAISLAASLQNLAPIQPLPNPLPTPPPAPLRPIQELGQLIENSNDLTYEQQSVILVSLRDLYENREMAQYVKKLVADFRKRPDLDRRIARQLDFANSKNVMIIGGIVAAIVILVVLILLFGLVTPRLFVTPTSTPTSTPTPSPTPTYTPTMLPTYTPTGTVSLPTSTPEDTSTSEASNPPKEPTVPQNVTQPHAPGYSLFSLTRWAWGQGSFVWKIAIILTLPVDILMIPVGVLFTIAHFLGISAWITVIIALAIAAGIGFFIAGGTGGGVGMVILYVIVLVLWSIMTYGFSIW